MSEPLLLPARDAFAELGIGRDHGYSLIKEGRLKALHVGRRLLVPRFELEAFVLRELDEGGGDHTNGARHPNEAQAPSSAAAVSGA